jgi:hypothetical protein
MFSLRSWAMQKKEARRVKDTVDVGHLQLTACSRLA